jgi:F0F1-type ATP synthase membrane subunit c/vacuolar-type H+-ATPase subunit K
VAGAAGRPLNLAFHSFEARHACNRAASSSSGIGLWAYLAVFAATAAGYMAIRIGTAAIGAAAVLSSQGQLIITAVLIVAVIGNGQQLYVSPTPFTATSGRSTASSASPPGPTPCSGPRAQAPVAAVPGYPRACQRAHLDGNPARAGPPPARRDA